MKNSAYMMLMFLVACGGGGNDNDNRNSICESTQTLTGRFIDSPVEGLRYSSYDIRVADARACHFGTTNSNGEFFYEPGHHVLFSICAACPPIASFPAQAIVTPADIVDAAPSIEDKGRTFRNLVRFIQTLDVDESEFETDDAILTIIGRVTNTSNLVDTQTAEEHFNKVIADLPDYVDPRLGW